MNDHSWDDTPVTMSEIVREFVGGAALLSTWMAVAWMFLA